MNYIIDNTIIFDSSTGRLSRADDITKFNALPKPAILLLNVLVNNVGVIISRDSLMEAAWLDAGLTLSGHNLSTYIKVIRQNLSELEVEKEYIKTLPRTGMLFTVEVQNEESHECAPEVEPQLNEVIVPEETEPSSHSTCQGNGSFFAKNKEVFTLYFLAFLLICICAQTLYSFAKPLTFAKSSEHLVKVSRINKCDIYMLSNSSQASIIYASKYLQDLDFLAPCKIDPHYIFFSSLNLEGVRKDAMVMCQYNTSNFTTNDCVTYNWEGYK